MTIQRCVWVIALAAVYMMMSRCSSMPHDGGSDKPRSGLIRESERCFVSRNLTLRPDKESYGEMFNAVLSCIEQKTPPEMNHELVEEYLRGEAADDAFKMVLPEVMFAKCMLDKDKGSLGELLSGACPETIGQSPIELALAEEKVLDVIFVAVSHSEPGPNREFLEHVISRTFGPYVSRADTSWEEWISRCKAWLEVHRECEIDYSYCGCVALGGDQCRLFVIKK